jgi:lysophospholipase L1-like esterase
MEGGKMFMTHAHTPARMRWLIAAASLLVISLAGPAARSALADSPTEYLALGDSVAFGYSPLLVPTNAANFIGYPTPAAAALKKNHLTNASCPGETSSHFIELAGPDYLCGFWRANYPLHVTYGTSQLTFTDAFLAAHPKTQVISLNIGANDAYLLEDECSYDIVCITNGLPGLLATLSANLDTIYGHIRNRDRYHHKIVALTYYTPDPGDPLTTGVVLLINAVVADRTMAWGGVVADGFGAFAAASAAFGGDPCAAGLLIQISSSPLACDIHPTPAGRDLLGRAIVNALRER